ncbi:MAG: phosphoribosyltransferase [Ilumatobacteraceae bacterium]|nr:phosphoribosyltransferase [Ilumatobacteraceae bacterium]
MGEIVGGGAQYRVQIGSQQIDLPIVPINPDLAISLLMTIDVGISFLARAGQDLADRIADTKPDIVVSAATLGIPVAIETSRALGLDDYLILQKTQKLHLADALREPLSSITTGGAQELLLDRARIPAVAGRKVALVDDVIASGGSMVASLRLLRSAGADVVVIGTLLREGNDWAGALGDDAGLLRSLGTIPLFGKDASGAWTERP